MEKLTTTQIAIIQHIMQLKHSGRTIHAVFTPIPGTENHEAVTMQVTYFKPDSVYVIEHDYTGNMRCYLNGLSTVA